MLAAQTSVYRPGEVLRPKAIIQLLLSVSRKKIYILYMFLAVDQENINIAKMKSMFIPALMVLTLLLGASAQECNVDAVQTSIINFNCEVCLISSSLPKLPLLAEVPPRYWGCARCGLVGGAKIGVLNHNKGWANCRYLT